MRSQKPVMAKVPGGIRNEFALAEGFQASVMQK